MTTPFQYQTEDVKTIERFKGRTLLGRGTGNRENLYDVALRKPKRNDSHRGGLSGIRQIPLGI